MLNPEVALVVPYLQAICTFFRSGYLHLVLNYGGSLFAGFPMQNLPFIFALYKYK
jgi:hypothetical protein